MRTAHRVRPLRGLVITRQRTKVLASAIEIAGPDERVAHQEAGAVRLRVRAQREIGLGELAEAISGAARDLRVCEVFVDRALQQRRGLRQVGRYLG